MKSCDNDYNMCDHVSRRHLTVVYSNVCVCVCVRPTYWEKVHKLDQHCFDFVDILDESIMACMPNVQTIYV